MKITYILAVLASLFGAGCKPPPTVPTAQQGAEAMKELRNMMLTSTASQAGINPTENYPKVFGVVMDLPISNGHTATVVSMCDGHASLYTTSTFGVLGGIGHESVRLVSADFVRRAQSHFESATATADFPYPDSTHVRFYLLGFDGVRVIEAAIVSVQSESDSCFDLWTAGQRVLTELRLVADKAEK